ncbi:MAG TPA: sulfite exporter TauE/SafE family protein [Steroidobacteraceae bacterium]|nr:sulfite exporter TauE/SafE family protein [Steroidobacteraceae bacterium]
MYGIVLQWLPMIVALAAAGVGGGLLAGLLGVGGGIIIVPALDAALGLAGVSHEAALHVAVATSMATIVPTSISSARSHARRGSVDAAVVRRWVLPIVVGAVAGALAASYLNARILAGIFGAVALLSAVKMLLPLDRVVLRPSLPTGLPGAILPASIGAIAAMMGIGGGTMSVPAMTLCGEPVHKAVGTAALVGFWISTPATVGYLMARVPAAQVLPPLTVGYVSVLGFALIAPLSWLMAPYGARLAHALDRRKLSAAFGVFLLIVAIRMLYRAFA